MKEKHLEKLQDLIPIFLFFALLGSLFMLFGDNLIFRVIGIIFIAPIALVFIAFVLILVWYLFCVILLSSGPT